MATADGTVKKTELSQFSRPRPSGLIALGLTDGNTLVGAAITDGRRDILLTASSGKAARFKESDVRAMGRSARGVRGHPLRRRPAGDLSGHPGRERPAAHRQRPGLRQAHKIDEFPVKGRGAGGVIAMKASKRNGELVAAVQVFDGDELMLISDLGTLVRTGGDGVSIISRNAQGVRLIKLREGEKPQQRRPHRESMLNGEAPTEDSEDAASPSA